MREIARQIEATYASSKSAPQVAIIYHCFLWEAARDRYAPGPGGPIAKDVPVLRVNHAALQDVLPGVRQVSRTSLKFRTAQKSIRRIVLASLEWMVQ